MRSPVAIGIVLGLVVGGAAAAAIAATSSSEQATSSASPKATVLHPAPTEPAPGAIERLAAAFDLRGPVQADAGGWVVHDGDRLLRVQRAAGLPWFFSRLDGPCKIVPESPAPDATLQTVPPGGPSDCPETDPAPLAPTDLLGEGDAVAFGMQVLERAGAQVSNPVSVDEPGGWYIEASPTAGSTAGKPWTITVGPGRTVSAASGYLAVETR